MRLQKSMVVVVYLVLGLMFGSAGAQANLLKDFGGFEQGINPPQGTVPRPLGAGSKDIAGWTVTAGNIQWIHTLWPAYEGVRSIEFLPSGAVATTFPTSPGQTYEVTFSLSGNYPYGNPGPGTKELMVSADGQTKKVTWTKTNNWNWQNMEWKQQTFTFKADNASATLAFRSPTGGAVLDNVMANYPQGKPSPGPGVEKPEKDIPVKPASDLTRASQQHRPVNQREGEGFVKEFPPRLTSVSGQSFRIEVTLDVDPHHRVKTVVVSLYPFDKNGKRLWDGVESENVAQSGRSQPRPGFTLASGVSPSQVTYLLAVAEGKGLDEKFKFCKTYRFAEVRASIDGTLPTTQESEKKVEEWRKKNIPGYKAPIPGNAKLVGEPKACLGVIKKSGVPVCQGEGGNEIKRFGGYKTFRLEDSIWILAKFRGLPKGQYVLQTKWSGSEYPKQRLGQTIQFTSDGPGNCFVWFPVKYNDRFDVVGVHKIDIIVGGRSFGRVEYTVEKYLPARIVGKTMSKKNENVVYTYYNNGYYSVGDIQNRSKFFKKQSYKLPEGKSYHDIIGMAMSPDETIYTWFKDGTYGWGPHNAPAANISDPNHHYSLPKGKTRDDIVGMAMAPDNKVYVWFRDGKFCIGTANVFKDQLYDYRPIWRGKPIDGMAIDKSGRVLMWAGGWNSPPVYIGTPVKLDQYETNNIHTIEGEQGLISEHKIGPMPYELHEPKGGY